MADQSFLPNRHRLDRAGVILSGLCAVHCVLGLVLVSVLGLGGELLLRPEIHEIGLAAAIVVGVVTLGFAAWRHGRIRPLAIGGAGLSLMSAGLMAPHGLAEALFTIAGVGLVATAHVQNLRHAA